MASDQHRIGSAGDLNSAPHTTCHGTVRSKARMRMPTRRRLAVESHGGHAILDHVQELAARDGWQPFERLKKDEPLPPGSRKLRIARNPSGIGGAPPVAAGSPGHSIKQSPVYTPPKFKVDDLETIRHFVSENSFGLLLSVDDGCICDTHTPFIISEDGQRLLGHIARANPQWKSWKGGAKVKVIFTGSHSYISPRFYVSEFAVPTWNYTAVSIAGRVTIIEDQSEVLQFLDQLIADNESSDEPWLLDRTDERYLALLSGIVVFSVSMDSVEASFKMSQNKSEEDQKKVIASLSSTACPFDRDVARIMSQNLTDAE